MRFHRSFESNRIEANHLREKARHFPNATEVLSNNGKARHALPQVLGLQIETQAIEKAGDDDKAIRKIGHHVLDSRSGIRFRNELLVGRRKLHHPGVVNLPKDFPQIIQEILILRKSRQYVSIFISSSVTTN